MSNFGSTIRQYPECSQENKKLRVFVVINTLLGRISPAFLASGLVPVGDLPCGQWSGQMNILS